MLKFILLLILLQECCCAKTNFNSIKRGGFVTTKYGTRPTYFDWRDKNMVTPVKNQMRCAACWAFSALGNIESHLLIHRGSEVILSEQYLVDCYGGCGSRTVRDIFSDITNAGGTVADRDYFPYADGPRGCRYNGSRLVTVTGYRRVLPDEDLMAQYLYEQGPLSAGINDDSMVNYNRTNTIDQPDENQCSHDKNRMNHAVVIVGYNVYVDPKSGAEVPYWIVKNSWGIDWGDHGYYYLERGRNSCGIANDVAFALVN